MNKSNTILFIKKLIFFFLGVFIIQAGVAIFINTNIGSDPFTVFTQGISKILGITTGRANIIITSVFLIAIFIVARKTINIGTVLSLMSAGLFIDLMINVLKPLELDSFNIGIKIILLVLSCVIIAIGFSMLKATDLGVAPNDLIPFIIKDKTKLSYRTIRISMDLLFVTIGFMLGGVVGIGTIIAAFLTGPIIQFFMPKLDKIVKSILYCEPTSEVAL